jgi:hypothetical protein
MVHNPVIRIKLPYSNAISNMRGKIMGKGNGSVLLRTGGAGGGSSYSDIDDYIATTGINPYSRSNGKGLTDKLQKLSIGNTSSRPTRKNITM